LGKKKMGEKRKGEGGQLIQLLAQQSEEKKAIASLLTSLGSKGVSIRKKGEKNAVIGSVLPLQGKRVPCKSPGKAEKENGPGAGGRRGRSLNCRSRT